jgi:hypothetical protein
MKTSKSFTKKKQSTLRNRNDNMLSVTVNLDLAEGQHTATVHHAGSRTTVGAGQPKLPPSTRGTRGGREQSSSHARRRGTGSTGTGSGHPRSAGEPTPGSSHRLSFKVVLGDGDDCDVHESGQTAKAVTPTGDVVWTGRVSGPTSYETETTALSDTKTATLLRSIHSYHVAKAIPAGGPGSVSQQSAERRSSGRGARDAAPARGRTTKKAAAKRLPKPVAKKTDAKKSDARKTDAKKTGAKKIAAKASKARSFVKLKADGKVVNTYGPYDKVHAKRVAAEKLAELKALAEKPGAMSVEVVSASGEERARLVQQAQQGTPPARKTAAKKTAAAGSTKKTATPKPASSRRSAPETPASSTTAGANKPASNSKPKRAKPPSPRKGRAEKVVGSTTASTPAAAVEEAPRTKRAPVSVGDDETVFAKLRAGIQAEKPDATATEIDSELAMFKHAWRAGAREKVIAWMHEHQIADVAKGFENWIEHNEADAMALMAAPSRAA